MKFPRKRYQRKERDTFNDKRCVLQFIARSKYANHSCSLKWPECHIELGEGARKYNCCVFRPAFGCCGHLKAGQTTFFQPFSTFFDHLKKLFTF